MSPSRRDVLALAGLGSASLALGSPTVLGTTTRFSLGTAHTEAANKARQLARGRAVALTVLYPDGALGNVQRTGELFTQMSGIPVSYLKAPLDEINSLVELSTITSGEHFDLALPATFGIPDLAEVDSIENLDLFSAHYEPARFQQDALYSLGDYYRGSLYGYLTDGDAFLMFYNRPWLEDEDEQSRYFDRFGVPLGVPGTWEELDRAIAFFHRPEQGRYGGSLYRIPNYIHWEWWMRFHAKGYFPLDDNLKPQLNNDAGVQALEELIAVSQYLEPGVNTNGAVENFKTFAQGHIFCNYGWGGHQKYYNSPASNVQGKLTYSPAPGGVINGELLRMPFFNWGWNYTVSANSTEKEIAYLFALFACSPYVSTIAIREIDGFFDPFRNSHYADPAIIDAYSEDFLVAHQASMRDSIPDFYLRGHGEYMSVLKENLIQAYRQELTPKESLDLTARQWRRIHRKMGISNQREQWKFLKSAYPAKARKLLT